MANLRYRFNFSLPRGRVTQSVEQTRAGQAQNQEYKEIYRGTGQQAPYRPLPRYRTPQ